MHSYLSTQTTILISISVLVGWVLSDFQARFVVDTTYAHHLSEVVESSNKIDLTENFTSPDIVTNWFTGSSASMSSQLPLGQTRKSDEDEHISQGRLVGESFGNDKP